MGTPHPYDEMVQLSAGQLVFLRIYSAILAILGLALLVGGVWLAYLGGAIYYAIVGALGLAAATLLFQNRQAGAWIYAIALNFSLAWAVYEVGFDGWALMPRLAMLLAFGAFLLVPFIRRSLVPIKRPDILARKPVMILLGGAIASVGLGAALHMAIVEPRIPDDPRFQTGRASFPEQGEAISSVREDPSDWREPGRDRGGTRFSPLKQVTPENVKQLKVAWSVDVGEHPGSTATPIKVGDSLYTCNNLNEVFALDAGTGKLRWRHDAANGRGSVCRGVSFYQVQGQSGPCAARILTATNAAQLIALDAATGRRCPDFGRNGVVDLLVGMADAERRIVRGYYRVRSAPTIVLGKAVLGGFITDNQYWGEPSGVIRAFDAVTGKLAWAWDMGRPERAGEPREGENYTPATPNSWAPMSVDEELGLVYAPMGNATPDLFGGNRREFDDRYSSSVVALDAETGHPVWSFQTRHHDLWDHDVASQPILIDLADKSGRARKALVQPTKQGEIFVLDRETGKPIFDVTEKPAPQRGAVPEERLSPTQPYSDGLPSFRGADLREADMWGISPLDQLYCRIQFKRARYEGRDTPPGLTPSIIYPSMFGAINWGSVSIDPVNKIMVVNSNRMANYVRLLWREEVRARGLRREGEYTSGNRGQYHSPQENTPYGVERPYWLTPLGVPCLAPPYGLLSAVDLRSGRLLWTQRFGTARGSGPLGVKFPFPLPMGTPNHGGSLITATGLLFIGATPDGFFHAYALKSGKEMWRMELPGGGNSQPISYLSHGRQFIVISAGGSVPIRARQSTRLVAFTLP